MRHKPVPIPDPHKKAKIRRGERLVKRAEAMDHQYVFGGGRICGYPPCSLRTLNDGDCSWWQGLLVTVMGYKLPFPASQLSTYSLAELPERDPKHFAAGPGKYYTMRIKNVPGEAAESHTIGEFRGRFTECGGSDNPHDDGRPTWFTPGEGMGLTVIERLDEFPTLVHIVGL